jgi:hypothetical protein
MSNPRDIGLQGAGKGCKERSTKWRANYDDINWPSKDTRNFHKVYRRVDEDWTKRLLETTLVFES